MTREERENALHCLRVMIDEEVCEECNLYGTTGTDHCEADCVRAVIEALEQEPCNDCVSREEIKQVVRGLATECAFDRPSFDTKEGYKVIPTKYHKGYEQALIDIEEKIKALPPVQPKQEPVIHAKWEKFCTKDGYLSYLECSNCSQVSNQILLTYNYCPHCGARMDKE